MKCRIVKVGCVFLGILFLGACAEKKNEVQDVEDIVVESDVSDEEEEEEKGIVLHSDVLTQNGTFEQTWSPDYDSSVWEDSPKHTCQLSSGAHRREYVCLFLLKSSFHLGYHIQR